MTNSIDKRRLNYLKAESMFALGMTKKPQVSQVAENLRMLTVATPQPGAGQVAVELRASAMHIDEVYAAQGTCLGRFYGPKVVTPSEPYVLGSSVSGIVVARGWEVHDIEVGDAVVVVPHEQGESSSWAEYRCVDQNMVLPKPQSLTHVETAAVTMAACVAWGVVLASKVKTGDCCVVVGASGSVGGMVVQFLKSMDCFVTAVCSESSRNHVIDLGADAMIDYRYCDFGQSLREAGRPQNVVFDCVGGKDTERSAFKALGAKGVFATIVGPQRYIGETKLSWWGVAKVLGYIVMRMLVSRFRGPRYIFGERPPRHVIGDALARVEKYGLRMPTERVVAFGARPIVDAVKLLTTHRAKGRIVIDFSLPRP